MTDRYGRFSAQPFERGFGTTLGQIASRGGVTADSWFIGFNISRKFF